MSVIYQKGGGGLLGTLGTLASLGGEFIPGAQWLTPLGIGMKALSGDTGGALKSAVSEFTGSDWLSKILGSSTAQNPLTDEQAIKKWSPFRFDSTGGYGTWLR